jgi:hypothetical protein
VQSGDIFKAELDYVESLITAFAGGKLIFSVTKYKKPFFRPDSTEGSSRRGSPVCDTPLMWS